VPAASGDELFDQAGIDDRTPQAIRSTFSVNSATSTTGS